MSNSIDRDAMLEDLKEAQDESIGRKDATGQYGNIFKEDTSIPEWICKEGDHIIDIIPYMAGKHDPNRAEGKFQYVLDIWVHRNVGAGDDSFVCPSRNYKMDCPICEDRKEKLAAGMDYKDPIIKAITPSRRNIYNIICFDSETEQAKGVQVWEVANFFMEDKLRAISKDKRTGQKIYFPSTVKTVGRSISFTKKGKGQGNVEFLGHQFLERDYDIPDDLVLQAITLDEVIVIPTYDELAAAYYGQAGKSAVSDTPAHEEKQLIPARQRTLFSKGNPAAGTAPAPTQEPKQEEVVSASGDCPHGFVFGKDCDKKATCNKCAVWDNCAVEADKLTKNPTPAPTPAVNTGTSRLHRRSNQ